MKGVMLMVIWSELLQFTLVIIGVAALILNVVALVLQAVVLWLKLRRKK